METKRDKRRMRRHYPRRSPSGRGSGTVAASFFPLSSNVSGPEQYVSEDHPQTELIETVQHIANVIKLNLVYE